MPKRNNIYTHMAAQATKVIHSRAAYLYAVTINTHAASAVLTLYNNTAGSGDVIAIINGATAGPVTLKYECITPQGLTAVLSGGDADVTILSEGPQV